MEASHSATRLPLEEPDPARTVPETSYDELVRACERLATERTRYQDLFASCRDACVITDAKGIITDANRRAGELLGIAPSALHRKLLIAFVARGDTRVFRRALVSAGDFVRSGKPVRVRLRARGGAPFEAVLWIDTGWRGPKDPVFYRWTIHAAPQRSPDESGLHAVLGAVARLAQSLPAEGADVPLDENGVRVGDSVVKAIQGLTAVAEGRRVRFVVEGGGEPDFVRLPGEKLDQSIATLLSAVLGATRDEGELHIRLGRDQGEVVLDLHAQGVDAGSLGSPLSLVLLAAHLAAAGGRLQLGTEDGQSLTRVRWPAVS